MQDFLYIKEGVKVFQIQLSELQYVEAAQRYIRLVTTDRIYIIDGPLSEFEDRLPRDQFCRIHRSFIVSFKHAHQLGSRTVIISGRELPVGRRYSGLLWAKIEKMANAFAHKKIA
jgi:two-component system LytT family response regulator